MDAHAASQAAKQQRDLTSSDPIERPGRAIRSSDHIEPVGSIRAAAVISSLDDRTSTRK